MKRLWKAFLGITVALYASACLAGNRELMAENAEQLIRLSDAIAETIVPKHTEGRYWFSARVVGQGPTRRFGIDALRSRAQRVAQAEQGGGQAQGAARARNRQAVVFAPAVFMAGESYQSLISIGSIPAPVIGLEHERGRSFSSSTPSMPDGTLPTLAPGGGRVLKSW